MTSSTSPRHVASGVVFVLLLALTTAGVVALYRGDLRDTVPVSVRAERAGLTMDAGAAVKMRGVEIGRVASVEPAGDGALIELDIDTDKVDRVPAELTAQIVPPTAFGAKYVQLTPAPDAGDATLQAGAVIPADAVTVEVDETFTHLTEVLAAARPSEVNDALTAFAEAVDGRGEQLGALVTRIDDYLASFNPSLPSLVEDLERLEPVVATYDAALPDLVTAVDRAAVTGTTITSQQASLRAFTLSLSTFSAEAEPLLERDTEAFATALETLAPVSDVLARYSPELPCVVMGAVLGNRAAERAVGGTRPGISTYTRIQPGAEPYRNPDDLPEVRETRGPNCFGLPDITPEKAAALPTDLDTGANPYAGGPDTPAEDATDTLRGLIDGLVRP